MPLEVQALRIGDVGAAGLGAEAFHALGLALRDGSPARHTVVCGYANGLVGYLPTAEAHRQGGYEVDVAPYLYRMPGRLAASSGGRAVERGLALLRGLWGVAPPS